MVAGLVRSKLFALFLGPANVGLTGLYANVFTVLASIGTLGVNASLVTNLPKVQADADRRKLLRSAFVIAIASSGVLAVLLVLLNPWLPTWTGLPSHPIADPWLVGGALLSIWALFLTGVLQAKMMVASYARSVAVGAIVATTIAAVAVPLWGVQALGIAVLCAPLGTFIVASYQLVRHREDPEAVKPPTDDPASQDAHVDARRMVQAGLWMMTGVLVQAAIPLALRLVVTRNLGLHDAGLYHVAWLLSTIAVNFLLVTMSADYLPRASQPLGREGQSRLFTQAVRTNLLLGGIVLAATAGFASLGIYLAFSREFVEASGILRLYCIGAVFQILNQNLGYLLMAHDGAARLLLRDVAGGVTAVVVASLLVGQHGLAGVGLGFIAGHVIGLIVAFTLAAQARIIDFKAESFLLAIAVATGLAATFLWPQWAMLAGTGLAATLMLILVRTADRAMLARVTARLPRIMKRKG